MVKLKLFNFKRPRIALIVVSMEQLCVREFGELIRGVMRLCCRCARVGWSFCGQSLHDCLANGARCRVLSKQLRFFGRQLSRNKHLPSLFCRTIWGSIGSHAHHGTPEVAENRDGEPSQAAMSVRRRSPKSTVRETKGLRAVFCRGIGRYHPTSFRSPPNRATRRFVPRDEPR